MKFKRFVYSVLLVLFALILLADLGLWFLVPEPAAAEKEGDFAFPVPEGVTLPEGGTMPDGVMLPEGGTKPGNGSFPEGMDLPGSYAGREGARSQRPGRSPQDDPSAADQDPSTEAAAQSPWLSTVKDWFSGAKDWISTKISELQAYLPLGTLQPVQEAMGPYRLYILIGAAAGMLLCALRLAFLNKKIRQQEAENPLYQRRVVLWPAFVLLLGALGLVMYLFPAQTEEEAEGAVADVRVLSGTVTEKTLTSRIESAGALEEQEAVSLTVPASIQLSAVCVRNGDAVTAGQIIARADRTSIMQAIASVHQVLSEIDGQLQSAHEAKSTSTLTAPAAGTVKAVYAAAGEKAMDVMAEHGALMLLSLDGCMGVQIPAGELSLGDEVTITLADGTALPGQVSYLEEGVASLTLADRGYAIGEQVSITAADGRLLGSGALYVNKPLHITGYLGTITGVYRSEGSTVYAGTALIGLNDAANLAEYEALLQERAKYEAELKTLFEIYEDGYIHAPCDGVVDGLSEELAYAPLSDVAAGLILRPVALTPDEATPQDYVHYIGEVLENVGGLLSLNVGASPISVSAYTPLPDVPAAVMTGTYAIPGSTPIYQFSGGWNPIVASDILVGDKLLFTFDANGSLLWVIAEHTAGSVAPTPTPTPTPTPDSTPHRGEGTPAADESPSPSASSGAGNHAGGGRTGGGSSIRVPSGRTASGSSGTSARQATYAIAERELCTVTPQERMLLVATVDELDVLSLSLGQAAEVYLDALPAEGFTATVTKIDPEGENSGGNTKYSITLALDRTPQLYPGMNATVCFPRSEGQSVPTVPLAALEEEGNRTLIYTAYDEETDALLSPVEVQTGLSDGTDVEIAAGLSPGDAYWYRYADAISYVTE